MLTIVENALTAETYCRLRQKCGFAPIVRSDAAAALKNSLSPLKSARTDRP